MAEKKLEVKDLTISFRTINGKVQAVRDISFDLYKDFDARGKHFKALVNAL